MWDEFKQNQMTYHAFESGNYQGNYWYTDANTWNPERMDNG